MALTQPPSPQRENEITLPEDEPANDPSSELLIELLEDNTSDIGSRLKVVNDRSMQVSVLDESKEINKSQGRSFYASFMGMFGRQVETNDLPQEPNPIAEA